jgi:3,8-divinyl chlorophyllide a/chlorophyllide a reductase subunit Y
MSLHAHIAEQDRTTTEIVYDSAAVVPVVESALEQGSGGIDPATVHGDGTGCHAGAGELRRAARIAGKSETLDRYAADYPAGPHDQPQSMCPAFGSLRVGLRMRRTATVLSGSACCVYGLTFTSHFYGARRTAKQFSSWRIPNSTTRWW